MSRPDTTASAALDQRVIKPVFFAFLDIVGDPVRVNTAGTKITLAATGQQDLDGEYLGLDPRVVEVSPLRISSGGNESVTARLSGIRGLDDDDRALLADPANWQGRTARLWRMIRDKDRVQQGGIQHYYTGYMMSLLHAGSPDDGVTIEVTIEGYLAAFSQSSGNTYLSQAEYDPGDLSAKAALAIANGITGNPLVANTGMPSGGRAGMFNPDRGTVRER